MTEARKFVQECWPYDLNRLPTWFVRPWSKATIQGTLFALKSDEVKNVLVALSISADDLERWFERSWVSFELKVIDPIEEWHVNELRFVRDVVRSGLSDAQIEAMLADLPRPMNFDPAQVAYCFSLGWVQAIPASEPCVSEFMPEHFEEWLQELAEDDPARLVELRLQLDRVIASIEPNGSADGVDGSGPKDTP